LSKQNINQDPWNTLNVFAITIFDPATGWFEVAELKDKTAQETSKVLDQVWFCCYPQPLRCITDIINFHNKFQQNHKMGYSSSTPTGMALGHVNWGGLALLDTRIEQGSRNVKCLARGLLDNTPHGKLIRIAF